MDDIHYKSMTHKQIMEELAAEMCGVLLSFQRVVLRDGELEGRTCVPVCATDLSTDGNRKGEGRRCSVYCRQQGWQTKHFHWVYLYMQHLPLASTWECLNWILLKVFASQPLFFPEYLESDTLDNDSPSTHGQWGGAIRGVKHLAR